MNSFPTSTAMIRNCPVCGDKAVLRRSDELCSECLIDIVDKSACKALKTIVDVVSTADMPFVVADMNIHSGQCPNQSCRGLFAATV